MNRIVLTALLIAAFSSSCKREQDIPPADKFILEGQEFLYTSRENFDNAQDLSEWTFFPGGTATIDTINFYEGNSSIKLIADSACFNVEKIEGIGVSHEEQYAIHFYYKMPVTTMNELNNGFGWTCMGPFRIELKQGNDVILSEWVQENDLWTEKYYYFQPINDVPVKINFLIGTKKGLWLDNLITIEKI